MSTITTVDGITWREVFPSRGMVEDLEGADEATLVWVVSGSDDRLAVQTSAAVVVPLFAAGGEALRRITYDPTGPGVWEVRAQYTSLEEHERNRRLEPGEFRITFDTTGGSGKQQFSPVGRVTSYAPSGQTATDYKGAINVNNGKVEGVDVDLPSLKISVTHKHAQGVITISYMELLSRLTPSRNSAPFMGFAAKRLKFAGASGGDGSDSPAEITYNFVADENLTGLAYGSITGVVKDAHDYLWVDYAPTKDTAAHTLRPEPRGVYVHQLLDDVDFSQFLLTL